MCRLWGPYISSLLGKYFTCHGIVGPALLWSVGLIYTKYIVRTFQRVQWKDGGFLEEQAGYQLSREPDIIVTERKPSKSGCHILKQIEVTV